MDTKEKMSPLWLFVLAASLLLLKSLDAILLPQFWAEDGAVFFAGQFRQVFPPLFTPYAGYLHFVPRLVAWIASWFNLQHGPLIYNSFAIIIDAFCIAYTSIRIGDKISRYAVFASFFLVPTAGDIFGTITNSQWFMQFAIASTCFTAMPASLNNKPRILRFAGYIALAIASLSGPFSIFIAGLVLCTLFVHKYANIMHLRPLECIVSSIGMTCQNLKKTSVIIVLVCACIQLMVFITSESTIPSSYDLTPTEQILFGVRFLPSFYAVTVNSPFSGWHEIELIVISAVLLSTLCYSTKNENSPIGIICLFICLGVVQPILAFICRHQLHTLAASSHYFYLLTVVCCWCVWYIVGQSAPRFRKSLIVMAIALMIIGFLYQPFFFVRQPLPDLNWPYSADYISHNPTSTVTIPLNPPHWCFRL